MAQVQALRVSTPWASDSAVVEDWDGAEEASSYRPIESLRRGLEILLCLNQALGGRASIKEISAATGLHRTTVRRMLETLQNEGYVRRNASDEHYSLNHKVRQLSDGFTDEDWVSEVAGQALGRLLQKAVWPSDLCTLDGDSMVVRETTHRFSPLSFHRAMIRRRLPMLFTAAGRAYLSACPSAEREEILRLLQQGNDEQARLARNPQLVAALLQKTREQGFGSNDGDWTEQARMSAIALPIHHGDRVLGCINIIFTKKAMTTREAEQRLLPALQTAVAEIESHLMPEGAAAVPAAAPAAPALAPHRETLPDLLLTV
ncbi:DNA-binding transcriptional regulator [Pseudomonas sp. S 311-6]|uniref:IclR family transcriptional regulator n=1 Tax=Kerstersia gyiorum TaxID=206506 RepID=A0A4Q7MBS5_9BURK|nr:DNA-binding transcriptional regulator [Kerstersia gyiorum]KAB0542202.1 DNA-binding transcriptional regulator [Kerstersia gyiorum]MCO7643573.1 DNA-binding transcriptional regulator [Pseudomonas sp. S 311-6]RZS65241.1 IclR family transcriptional regulator [Kerstersia gyiorum]